ncbi:DUF1538 domain-containing protein [Dehalogenimonas etheniformans]|uniref:DUF1538 domain-containing protein n=1 Tax=Dehalogenimonas etheniformans TaxID=1536648 RepID=A0A2P5P5A8_9CHLR|nr:DUF1538 domain-containing protein [Dehalogenimonas etheniformans]PPD57476.1 DUF1538 domain-containing protein [Dehalogenimonas etheniformans]QNT76839.1 DUF1538 domain-containing protein [Dehalogenimonas etheniformans]
MTKLLKDTVLEVVWAAGPLVGVIIILQFVLVRASAAVFIQFLVGTLFAIAGITLFLIGIEVGILPAGKAVGAGLVQRRSFWLIVGIAFLIGFATTIAEPDVLVLADRAQDISGGAVSHQNLIYIIGIGVAFFVVMAMLRILRGIPIAYLLTAGYLIVIALSMMTPADYVSLAFDSGSVTTGALTAPIIISLGVGFSSVLAGRSSVGDGFGIIGLASIGPIIGVLVMGIFHS